MAKNIVRRRLRSETLSLIIDTDYRLGYSRSSSLACLAVVGIIHLDSLSSSREIYHDSLIAIKILLVQQPVGFVVKSKQLGGQYHLGSNNGNKMVSIALLIGLVRRTLNQSIFLLAPTGRTAPMGTIKLAPKQAHKALLSPTNGQNQAR